MDIRRIDDNYGVSAQIDPGDVAAIRDAGYRSIVCNRPDGEDPGQPTRASIEAAAREAGLAFAAVPIVSGQLNEADVAAMAAAIEDLPQPVFAYCRSGTRSTNVYAGVLRARG